MTKEEKRIAKNNRQNAKRKTPRIKICEFCKKEYLDTTKKQVGISCSKTCASQLMVLKRHSEGSYIRTEEQNRRMVEAMKAVRANGGCRWSDKAKKEAKLRSQNPEIRGKITAKARETYIQKCGVGHWSQTLEGRQRISEIHSGKKQPPGHQRAMVEAALKSQNVHSRSKKGIREDLGCFFRSTWEANYARYLNEIGVKWKYESMTYSLGQDKTYTPDFILEDGTHVEIKGWLMAKGAEKIRLFQEQHPHIPFKIIGRPEYNALKKQYQFLIKYWEKS